MASNRRERSEVNARRDRVWVLWTHGWSVNRLTAKENVHPSQISRDLKARRDKIIEHQQIALEQHAQMKDRAIGNLEEVMIRAWEGWDKAKEGYARQRSKEVIPAAGQGRQAAGGGTEAEVVTETRLPDPQYLNTVIKSQQQINFLNGIVRRAGP
jgi:hypothetical protein